MDPISIVVSALAAGAAAGVSAAATTAVTDAYQALKNLVMARLRRGGIDDDAAQRLIAQTGDQAGGGRDAMTSQLTRVDVDDPTVEAAERLLELLKDKGKFHVTLNDPKGVIVGDHATQHNTFN